MKRKAIDYIVTCEKVKGEKGEFDWSVIDIILDCGHHYKIKTHGCLGSEMWNCVHCDNIEKKEIIK